MERWQKSLLQMIRDPEFIAEKFALDAKQLKTVAKNFRFGVSRYYFSLIKRKGDAIYRQCIPDAAELEESSALMEDPLGEEASSPAPNLVHRYPSHCLLLVSDCCASYCRFCTRKRKFGGDKPVSPADLDAAFSYIEKTTAIRDLLISGGDPLLLTDEKLEKILQRLRAIPHVEILRIGSRVPCTLPERITVRLVRMLKKYHPLYINVHFNHPDELTPQAVKALGRLADAGIPLGSQTVLLKGVNDDPEILKTLMRKLLAARVRPYYLLQGDLVRGTEHFRVPLARGLELMRALRGHISGLGVPHYIIDLPGGGGKVELAPDQVRRVSGNEVTFVNFCGREYVYPDISALPAEAPFLGKEVK